MKRLFFIAIILFSGTQIFCQTKLDSTRIVGYIPVYHADETQWIKRYQNEIEKFESENKTMNDFSCDVLFLGSSSINLWHNIHNDMAPLKIIHRSYGGSTIRDNIYNYNTIARGYKPKKIAIYIENDLGKGKTAISPAECYDLFRIFVQMLKQDYPDIPIYIISLKPSFLKEYQIPDQIILNSLLEDYARRTSNVGFIDITKVMYDSNGKIREDIFIEDRLHMNQKGYDSWKEIIRPVLMEDIH